MAVKIRLARHGTKKKPFYRVVATQTESPRDGRFLDVLGTYDPRDKAEGIKLDVEAIKGWVSKGAQLCDSVARIMKQAKPGGPQGPVAG